MSTYKSMSSGDTLVPRSAWKPNSALKGDVEVLNDDTGAFDTAFQRVLELHEPNHSIALFSLCTSTRPYWSCPGLVPVTCLILVLSRFSSGYLPHLRCHAFESERALAA